jgi:mono/diheme cytochrome c family protein
MPAFGEKLTEEEQLAIIAWFQEKWSDEIYALWYERSGLDR